MLPLTQNPVPPGSTFTINQTHAAGNFYINGEVHPGMSINTGQWESDIVYKINNVEKYRKKYTAPSTGSNAYQANFPISSTLQLGTNTIDVGAECKNQPGSFCTIATFTIIRTKIEGNITLKDECCNWSVRLKMTGNFTGGTSVPGEIIGGNLKIEKEIGANNWVQEGALIPVANGGYTPSYPRPSQMTTQRYKATLLDFAGQPMTNNVSGTVFPMIFGICHECCIPKD